MLTVSLLQVRRKVVAVAARGKLLPERRGGTGGGSVRGTAGGTRSPQRRVERNEKVSDAAMPPPYLSRLFSLSLVLHF